MHQRNHDRESKKHHLEAVASGCTNEVCCTVHVHLLFVFLVGSVLLRARETERERERQRERK